VQDKNPQTAANSGVCTQMHAAADNGHFEICRVILDNMEDKNPVDSFGTTPLYLAAMRGHLETYRLILENVQVKNPANEFGHTLFSLAVDRGHTNVCQFCQEHLYQCGGRTFHSTPVKGGIIITN